MKRLICALGLFAASFSYATNIEEVDSNICKNDLSKGIECATIEFGYDGILSCKSSVTSKVTSNPDGSITRTTITTISCDTPEELAKLHKLMKVVGMGV